MTGVRVDSRPGIVFRVEAEFSSATTASDAFAASGTGSSSTVSGINAFIRSKARHRLSCGAGFDAQHSLCRGRLSRHGLHLYSPGFLGSKKLRFRSQPELQIPPLRAACLFPELESQAGDFTSVRGNCGWTMLVHKTSINPF